MFTHISIRNKERQPFSSTDSHQPGLEWNRNQSHEPKIRLLQEKFLMCGFPSQLVHGDSHQFMFSIRLLDKRSERKHELAMMDKNLEYDAARHKWQLQAVETQGQMVRWCSMLPAWRPLSNQSEPWGSLQVLCGWMR